MEEVSERKKRRSVREAEGKRVGEEEWEWSSARDLEGRKDRCGVSSSR